VTWLDQLAAALGVDPPSQAETGRILAAARDVAHGVERRITPLSTFVLGMAVERAVADGTPREAALDRAIEALRGSIPSEPAESPPGSEREPTTPG
jgi:Domain of unknown function (DUF6457)